MWDSIDKASPNRIDLDHELKKLFLAFIEGYIKTQVPNYDKQRNHKYTTGSRKVANEIGDDFEQILGVHGIYDDYITKPFYMQNFKKYFVEIKKDNY
eukprot:UN08166